MSFWRERRGSVLAQVLVLAVVGALIAASIIKARLQPAMAVTLAGQSLKDDLSAQSAVNRLQEVWSRLGTCSSDAAAGVLCSGAGCSCTCELGAASVTATPRDGTCVLKVVPH